MTVGSEWLARLPGDEHGYEDLDEARPGARSRCAGEPDTGGAVSPWFVKEGDTWHMYYVTAVNTAGPPGFVPAGPYNSAHAQSKSLLGPWVKTKGYVPVKPKPDGAGYPQSMAYPGHM